MVRIAHIADIHWRALSRHEEYREVFIALAERVRAARIEHVYVGGDVFHTKTSGISPEYIDQLTWWLNLLAGTSAEPVDVHLTLGNHDGNLINTSRQDAVTPIVEAMKHPRVHLYKKSGVYEFVPGYNWCIFSLFDEEGWKDVEPVPGKVNIACYHGPVRGAVTESDWPIEEGLNVGFFERFDFCFLGDIHRTQYLGARQAVLEVDERDLAMYPGAEVIK